MYIWNIQVGNQTPLKWEMGDAHTAIFLVEGKISFYPPLYIYYACIQSWSININQSINKFVYSHQPHITKADFHVGHRQTHIRKIRSNMVFTKVTKFQQISDKLLHKNNIQLPKDLHSVNYWVNFYAINYLFIHSN